MAGDPGPAAPWPAALSSLEPGDLIRVASGPLVVDIAPDAGGRIAQIIHDGIEWLVGYGAQTAGMISWGCFPMVPWAGRIRRGRFEFEGRSYQLPRTLGAHAIHGVGLGMPWQVSGHGASHVELSLRLPVDERWPFGGTACQRIQLDDNRLRMHLQVTASDRAMPVSLGWHPLFRKPERIEFQPDSVYPRDEEGIATLPLAAVPPGPWDDCFVNDQPVVLQRAGRRLRLTSDCNRWVAYDAIAHATCLEPQSGPPDAFNLEPVRLEPGASCCAWFLFEWV